MSTISMIVFGGITLIVLLVLFAPSILEGLRLRSKKVIKDIGKKVNDPVVTAEIRIDEAKDRIKEFQRSIRDLRKQVIKDERKEEGMREEVKKWESIFIQAKKAGSEEDAEQASRNLEKADKRLNVLLKNIVENRATVSSLQEQASEYLDRVENAEIIKESLEARKIAADLRKEAFAGGKFAADGLGALSELEAAADDSEAEVLALEEEAGDSDIVDRYSNVSAQHSDRLKRLMENV
jgi:phage shock protein A